MAERVEERHPEALTPHPLEQVPQHQPGREQQELEPQAPTQHQPEQAQQARQEQAQQAPIQHQPGLEPEQGQLPQEVEPERNLNQF